MALVDRIREAFAAQGIEANESAINRRRLDYMVRHSMPYADFKDLSKRHARRLDLMAKHFDGVSFDG